MNKKRKLSQYSTFGFFKR